MLVTMGGYRKLTFSAMSLLNRWDDLSNSGLGSV